MTQAKINYDALFKEYPDVVTIEQLCAMLGGISKKTVYKLLQEKKIESMKIGRSYRIPKYSVLKYLNLL